jgi:ABC-2 type transport system permease protein
MSWRAVAKKDFLDAIRSRLLIVLTVLFAMFSTAAGYFITEIDGGGPFVGELTSLALIQSLASVTGIFIPIVAIAAAYRSLAGERESGTLKILLSLPNSRADAVLGKFLGRIAVVSFALFVGFSAGLVVTAVFADAFSPTAYLVFVATSFLFAAVFVAITVGVSAFTSSTSRAAYGTFGLFIIFQFIWESLATGVIYALNGFSFEGIEEGDTLVDLFDVLAILNPTTAYEQGTTWAVRPILKELGQLEGVEVELVTDAPFYLQDWFGFIVMAVWILLPLAIGYYRFESTDL